MIFHWIGAVVRLLRYVLVPPKVLIPKRDVNAICPMCGHRKGRLSRAINGGVVAIQHTCLVCGCEFFEDTVLKAPDLIQAEPKTSKE